MSDSTMKIFVLSPGSFVQYLFYYKKISQPRRQMIMYIQYIYPIDYCTSKQIGLAEYWFCCCLNLLCGKFNYWQCMVKVRFFTMTRRNSFAQNIFINVQPALSCLLVSLKKTLLTVYDIGFRETCTLTETTVAFIWFHLTHHLPPSPSWFIS